jgi:protein-tyrosine phosphatase
MHATCCVSRAHAQACRNNASTRSRHSRIRMYSSNTNSISVETVDAYNTAMSERMGWGTMDLDPYKYHPERGLYYHLIEEDIIVGSQPQSRDDVIHLKKHEDVQVIFSMQQPKDLEYWGVDGQELEKAAHEMGMEYIRVGAVDFDPHSLRTILPQAVALLNDARSQRGRVYLHCTAGLGRAPAVAMCSLFWNTDMNLDQVYEYVTNIRPCGPNIDAIRGATFDVMDGRPFEAFQHLPNDAFRYLIDRDREVIKNRITEKYLYVNN